MGEETYFNAKLHPVWPTDKIHAAEVVSEESGELVQACNDYEYCDKSDLRVLDSIRKKAISEAIQTGAMAIRFLINMDKQ